MKNKEEEAISRVSKALHVQESFYKEKVGNKGLELGDRCTIFFYLEAAIKDSKKKITSLWSGDNLVEDEDEIIDHVVSYYKGLYKKGNIVENDVVDKVIHSISLQQNQLLTSVPNEEEIYRSVCQMSANSAPGLVGFGGVL